MPRTQGGRGGRCRSATGSGPDPRSPALSRRGHAARAEQSRVGARPAPLLLVLQASLPFPRPAQRFSRHGRGLRSLALRSSRCAWLSQNQAGSSLHLPGAGQGARGHCQGSGTSNARPRAPRWCEGHSGRRGAGARSPVFAAPWRPGAGTGGPRGRALGGGRAGPAGREGGDAWRGMPRTRGYFISSSKGVGRCWNPHGKFPLGEGPEGDSSAPGRWPQQPAPAAPSQVLPDQEQLVHLSGPPGQRCLPRAPHLARGVLATCSVARRASAAASAQ